MSVTTRSATAAWAVAAFPWWLPATGLTLAIAAALALSPYPPLQDFSEWVYQGALLARMAWGLPVPDVWLAHGPVPNSLAQALLGLLCLVLPATLAARVFVIALLGGGLAIGLALARRYQPAAAGAFAVVLTISFLGNTTFWNGYVNYQLALLVFAAWFLLPAAWRLEPWPILGFGIAIFLAHAMVFAAFATLVGAQALLARRPSGALLGLLPVGLLGLWYATLDSQADPESPAGLGGLATFLAYKAYTLTKLGPYHNFVFAQGGDELLRPALYWAGSAINLLYTAGLLAALGFGLWRGWRRGGLVLAKLLAALLLLGLFAVLPRMAMHVINPGERLMIPAMLALLLAVPLPPMALRPLAVLGGAALAANLLVFATPSASWMVPVHFRTMEAMGGARALYRHRPSSFACKWQELRDDQATGAAPDLPISFRTSLLKTDAPEFDCPVPGENRPG